MQYLGAKAGMNFTDALRQRIEEELGEGAYFKREQERRAKSHQRAEEHLSQLSALSPDETDFLRRQVSEIIGRTEARMYSTPEEFFCYLDLDMFFVACELRDRPELVGQPVAVGHSVISAANYEARKFGVRSAMPTFLARRLCPQLVLLHCHMQKYQAVSKEVFGVVAGYDEDYVLRGIDEGYFWVSISDEEVLHSPEETTLFLERMIAQIKREIRQRAGVTASIGVSFNPPLVKLCSEKNKPDGQFILRKDREAVRSFLDGLSVRKLAGVGPCLEQVLNELGIRTLPDLRESLFKVFACFYEKQAYGLLYASVGHYEAEEGECLNPSISRSETFRASENLNLLENILECLCQSLLRRRGVDEKTPRTLTIGVRYADFKVRSRSVSSTEGFRTLEQVFEAGIGLLHELVDRPIRLISVKLSKFEDLTAVQTLPSAFKRSALMEEGGEKAREGESLHSFNFRSQDDAGRPGRVVCPVCNGSFDFFGNNSALNRHIDRCMRAANGEQETEEEGRRTGPHHTAHSDYQPFKRIK